MPDYSAQQSTQSETSNRVESIAGRVSRRSFLRRAAVLGVSAPVIATLLAACGGDDDDAPETTTTSTSAETPAATSAATQSGGGAATETSGGATPEATSDATSGAATSTVAAELEGKPGGILQYAILREPGTFDPQIDNGHTSTTMQANVYDMLVSYNVAGEFVPGLAESWEASPDGISFTFQLREGVTFHSGDPFTSDDVLATIERIQDPETNATLEPEMSNVESATAPDDYTVEVVMKEPYALFITIVASDRHAGIVSRGWVEEGRDFSSEMNGTGPFMLDEYEDKVSYTFVKNPNYWEPGLPYLDGMVQTPILDDTARVNAFKSGQADFMAYVPWQNMMEFGADPNVNFYQGFDVFNLVRFNPQRAPFDNPLVRQAFNFIVDRQAMIDLAFGGQGLPISVGLIHPDSIWYNQELDGHWRYDPVRATELLAEAGITDPSSISLNFRSSSGATHFDTAQVIVQQLEQFGFKVELEQQDVATLNERRLTGDYQIMMDGLGVPWLDPEFYSTFFATGGRAHAEGVGYSNADLDQLLEEGRTTIEFEARKALYMQAEEVLMEDPPWIFLFWRPQGEVAAGNVKGYERFAGLGGYSEGFMKNVWFDE